MAKESSAQDPLEFVRNMWSGMGFSLPGMMTPTLDVEELDKRIGDLKAVEHWLKMNLNALQMTTQGLEIQRATLAAIKAMSKQAIDAGERVREAGEQQAREQQAREQQAREQQAREQQHAREASERHAATQAQPTDENPFAAAASMWPWNLLTGQEAPAPEESVEAKKPTPSSKASKQPVAEKPAAEKPVAEKPRAKPARKPPSKSRTS